MATVKVKKENSNSGRDIMLCTPGWGNEGGVVAGKYLVGQ